MFYIQLIGDPLLMYNIDVRKIDQLVMYSDELRKQAQLKTKNRTGIDVKAADESHHQRMEQTLNEEKRKGYILLIC